MLSHYAYKRLVVKRRGLTEKVKVKKPIHKSIEHTIFIGIDGTVYETIKHMITKIL